MSTATENKHTPGPWETRFDTGAQITVCQKDGVQNVVHIRWPDGPLTDEDRANARLIAAAPAMLEALEAISHFPSANISSDWMPIFEQVKAAIKLAKGESQ